MIIGVLGKGQSGKDEFANIAVNEFNATRVAFADAVKEEVAEFLNKYNIKFENRHLYGNGIDKDETFILPSVGLFSYDYIHIVWPFSIFCGKESISFRRFLQWWGTEYRRSQDPDYWVKIALYKCKDNSKLYIISDVRFINEVNAIKSNSGRLIKVYRSNCPAISNINHSSETALDNYEDYDYYILNNGTLEEYQDNCRKVLNKILGE